jgi:hypothetical protein
MDEQRRLEQLAFASLTEAECPDTDQLAAYMLGNLTGTEQLIIAAHIRECPLCQHDVAICRPPEPRPHRFIARLVPLSLLDGRRSTLYQANIRHYVAADLHVELTIAPPAGDLWRITGQILRSDEGLPDRTVIARAGRRRYMQMSDAQGFFTFDALPAGRYTLSVADGQIQVQIRDLVLQLDDME